jgi:hypothetical protein
MAITAPSFSPVGITKVAVEHDELQSGELCPSIH